MTVRRGFVIGFALTTGWMLPSWISILVRPASRRFALGRR